MAVRIGSNIGSLQAQRRLGEASAAVSTSFARLSSGQRINRASDDAAGLAISEALNSRSRVYARGAQNVSDGISLLSIADATLGELAGITTRIRELAGQAATGGYSNAQRQALDTEAQRLREEFFRISRATQFNGLSLFDGSIQGLRIQSGYGTDGGITSSLGGKLGTGQLDSSTPFTAAFGGFALATADFNGDGNIDVVTNNSLGNQLKYLRGNGDGTFAAAVDLVAGGTTIDVAAADFNNDGAMDIIAASGTTTLSLFLNNRAGGFNAVTNITTSGNASQVAAIDTNRDGRMDIVVANNNAGNDTVSVLLGSGAGTFASPTSVSLGVGVDPFALGQGDFNGDGTADLAVNGTSGAIQILLGNGTGSFGAPTVGVSFANLGQFTIGDFNGDGKADLAGITDGGGNTVSLYLRSADGASFGAFGSFIFTSTAGDLSSVTSGDINGDGNLDIVTTDSTSVAFTLIGAGGGAFNERFQSTPNLISLSESTMVDVNGDGTLDVVGTGGNVTSLLNVAQSGVNPILPFSLRSQADAAQSLAPLAQKLDELNKQRGQIGGFLSRLSTAGQSATTQSDGFRAAESRIRNVDIAEEAARLNSAQIRQQAATAVLAQANFQPRLALQLLRG